METLDKNMAGVIETLSTTTSLNWHVDHSGGGCYWIIAYLTDDVEGPFLAVTDNDGPLTANQTVDDVDAAGGWLIGYYPTGFGGDDEAEYIDNVATETLPLRVHEKLTESGWLS